MPSLQSCLNEKKKEWNSQTTLGKKLSDIGGAYLKAYSNSFHFFHSHKRQAWLLMSLADKDNEFALSSLIAILKTLPKKGQLSQALVQVISEAKVNELGVHNIPKEQLAPQGGQPQPYGNRDDIYFYKIARDIFQGNEGPLHTAIADTLLGYSHRLKSKPHAIETNENIYKTKHGRRILSEELPTSLENTLANQLAKVGQNYLDKHHNATSWYTIWGRHTHQEEAVLLKQLANKTDEEAKILVSDILLTLSKGELSKNIYSILEAENALDFVEQALAEPKRSALI